MIVGLAWTGSSLVPMDEQDLDRLRRAYAKGEVVSVDVKKARSLPHHRLHFARFREIVRQGCKIHGNRFHNQDALRAFVYVCVGWCDQHRIGPVTVPVPRSVNWSAVDQTVFRSLDQNIVLFLADELDPPIESITKEADELIARGVERTEMRDAA